MNTTDSPDTTTSTPATTAPAYRPKGKIAWLPKPVRDRIHQLLLDGRSYPAILRELGPDGLHLNVNNLWRYHQGPHRQWLREQHQLAQTRLRQESAMEILRDSDASQLNHAALQLGALHIFEALRDLAPGSLDKKLGGDSASFARLLNALSRASRETLAFQKYRDACARARAALKPMLDPKRKLTEAERRHLVLQVDEILGLPSQDDDPDPGNHQLPDSPVNPSPDSSPSAPLAAPTLSEGGSPPPPPPNNETPPAIAAVA